MEARVKHLEEELEEFDLVKRSNAKVILKINEYDKVYDYLESRVKNLESSFVEMEIVKRDNARILIKMNELESRPTEPIRETTVLPTEQPNVNLVDKRVDCYRFFIFLLILFQIGLFAIILILKK